MHDALESEATHIFTGHTAAEMKMREVGSMV